MKLNDAPFGKLLLVVVNGPYLKKDMVGFKSYYDGVTSFTDICNLRIHRNEDFSCDVELVSDAEISFNVAPLTTAHWKRGIR